MHTKVISGHVTTPAVLGQGDYGRQITITASGSVTPTAAGATAILGPAGLADPGIVNQGLVAGGAGTIDKDGKNVEGDAGIVLNTSGVAANAGSIVGGSGAYGGLYYDSGTGAVALK